MKLANKRYVLSNIIVLIFFLSYQQETKPIVVNAETYHTPVDKITEIIIHDIFSPPVASRILAYSNKLPMK